MAAQVAVELLDLQLRANEFLTFLGPSGSGKTTTLMMVAGLQRPDAGSIVLGGRELTGVPPYRRDLGMVFQNYALFPHMTVEPQRGLPARDARRRSGARSARSVDGCAATWSGCPSWGSGCRASCRAGSSSGWRWRGRWSTGRRCC